MLVCALYGDILYTLYFNIKHQTPAKQNQMDGNVACL